MRRPWSRSAMSSGSSCPGTFERACSAPPSAPDVDSAPDPNRRASPEVAGGNVRSTDATIEPTTRVCGRVERLRAAAARSYGVRCCRYVLTCISHRCNVGRTSTDQWGWFEAARLGYPAARLHPPRHDRRRAAGRPSTPGGKTMSRRTILVLALAVVAAALVAGALLTRDVEAKPCNPAHPCPSPTASPPPSGDAGDHGRRRHRRSDADGRDQGDRAARELRSTRRWR